MKLAEHRTLSLRKHGEIRRTKKEGKSKSALMTHHPLSSKPFMTWIGMSTDKGRIMPGMKGVS
jgi:hypothetical protein